MVMRFYFFLFCFVFKQILYLLIRYKSNAILIILIKYYSKCVVSCMFVCACVRMGSVCVCNGGRFSPYVPIYVLYGNCRNQCIVNLIKQIIIKNKNK